MELECYHYKRGGKKKDGKIVDAISKLQRFVGHVAKKFNDPEMYVITREPTRYLYSLRRYVRSEL